MNGFQKVVGLVLLFCQCGIAKLECFFALRRWHGELSK